MIFREWCSSDAIVLDMKKSLLPFVLVVLLASCANKNRQPSAGFNLFTIDQDKELGRQVNAEILSKPEQYPILDPVQYKEVYDYVTGIRDKILQTGEVRYAKEFDWEIKIINDTILNAFCTPGGYIYFYTGILKFLDSEDELAGVLGHEMAHADLRHSTGQMTRMFGVSLLVTALTGNRETLAQITTALIGLRFSRNHEADADFNSVKYLCKTPYNAAGGAGFFEKILALGGAQVPEFLSTHPSPDNRIEAFHNHKSTLGCQGNEQFVNRYKSIMSKLP
jgi:predicted Zn-dependent protease